MSARDRYAAYVTTCAVGGVLPCSYEAFAADEARACPATEAGIPASVAAGACGAPGQGGREGGHLMHAQSPETRMASGVATGLALGAHGGALESLVQALAEYIRTGKQLSMDWIGPERFGQSNIWGYAEDEMAKCRAQVALSPVIKHRAAAQGTGEADAALKSRTTAHGGAQGEADHG